MTSASAGRTRPSPIWPALVALVAVVVYLDTLGNGFALDDVEAIVHVFYDYTPIPARALDLYITYDQAALTLEDARPLALLKLQGKELASTHLSDGTLRLSVFDTGGSHPNAS